MIAVNICILERAQVTVDDFFLRYLGTEGLVLELNQARAADFDLIGRRQVSLSGLLGSQPKIILQREPLISPRDGSCVGYVHVEVTTHARRDEGLEVRDGCRSPVSVDVWKWSTLSRT